MMAKLRSLRIIVVAALVVGLIACDGPKEREKAYMARGKALYEEGNYVKARLEFRNALQINPKGFESRFYLAQIEQRTGNLRAAFAGFEKLVTEKPDHLAAQLELARLLFVAGQSGRALAKVKMILAAEPANASARALNGAIAMKAGDLDKAMAEAAAALKAAPASAEAVSVVAAVLTRRGRLEDAVKRIDGVIALNKADTSLRLLKINLHVKLKQFAEAEAVYKELIGLRPEVLGFRAALARLLAGQKRVEEAEGVLREAIQAMPKDAKAKLLLVDFLAVSRSAAAAKQALVGFVGKEPENQILLLGLAAFHEKQKEPKEAEAVYRKVIGLDEAGRSGVAARTALIRLKLREGDKKTADGELEKLLKGDPGNANGLLLRAGRSVEERNFLKAITDLRLVLRDDPNSTRAMKLLAVAHIRAGNQQLARETLQKLVRVDRKDVEARLQLAQLMARGRDYDDANALLAEILVQKPNHIQALGTKAEIALAQHDFGEAERIAREVLASGAPAAVSRRLLGLVYFGQGRHSEAVSELRAALEDDPKSERVLAALARSFVAAKQMKQGIAYLEAFVAKHADNGLAYEFLGEMSVMEGDLKRAEGHFATSARLKGAPAATYRKYGRALARTGHHAEAIAAYETALRADPDSEVLMFEMALAHQLAGDPGGAMELYRRILARNANVDAAANNLAALIADHRYKDKEALNEALRLANRFQTSQSPLFLDTLGWVHYRLGNEKDAIAILERAANSGQTVPAIHYHLGMAYLAAKQKDRAKEQLRKATVGDPKYTGVEDARKALAEL